MTKEALKLALEALEPIPYKDDWTVAKETNKAITAIKEALAQLEQDGECKRCTDGCAACDARKLPEQEPVAWISPKELLVMRGNAYAGAKDWRVNLGLEPEEGDVGLYMTPSQRTWVGLMEDEAMEVALEVISRLDLPTTTKMQLEQQFLHALSNPNSLWMLFAAEIEAKLEEKNT